MNDDFIPSAEVLMLAARDCASISSATERLVFGDGAPEPYWEPQQRSGGGSLESLRRMSRRGIRNFKCVANKGGGWDWIVEFRSPSCWSTTYVLTAAQHPAHYDAIIRARGERKELASIARDAPTSSAPVRASKRL